MKRYKGKMHVGIVQKGSACAHWYMKVSTGDAVLIPTHSYNEHSTLNYLINLEVHDCHPEFDKKLSLERLGERNGYHVNGGGILNGLGSLHNIVRDKKVATVEMLVPFG